MQLKDRRIVVTGGGSGCGAAGVRAFVREGAAVAVLDVLDEDGEATARTASDAGPGEATFYHCDVSQRSAVRDVMAVAAAKMNGLDTLVHAAAIEHLALPEDIDDAEWKSVMDVNLGGTVITNQEIFPYLRDNGGGRILNFGSGAAHIPFINGAHYAVSKAGVAEWTRTIAYAWGKHAITANVVNPAIAGTRLFEEAKAKRASLGKWAQEEREARDKAIFPLGDRRWPPSDEPRDAYHGDPDLDLAPALVFLVGDAARFITAQIVPIDGGAVPMR